MYTNQPCMKESPKKLTCGKKFICFKSSVCAWYALTVPFAFRLVSRSQKSTSAQVSPFAQPPPPLDSRENSIPLAQGPSSVCFPELQKENKRRTHNHLPAPSSLMVLLMVCGVVVLVLHCWHGWVRRTSCVLRLHDVRVELWVLPSQTRYDLPPLQVSILGRRATHCSAGHWVMDQLVSREPGRRVRSFGRGRLLDLSVLHNGGQVTKMVYLHYVLWKV